MKKLFLFFALLLVSSAYAYDVEKINRVFYYGVRNADLLFDENGEPGEDLQEFIDAMNGRLGQLRSAGKTENIPGFVQDGIWNGSADFTIRYDRNKELYLGLVFENGKIVKTVKGELENAQYQVNTDIDTVDGFFKSSTPMHYIVESVKRNEIEVTSDDPVKQVAISSWLALSNPVVLIIIATGILAGLFFIVVRARKYLRYLK